MKKLALGGLLTALTAPGLMADEVPALQIQTSDATDALALATIRSITYDGETSMLVNLSDTTLSYPIKEVQLITIGTVDVTQTPGDGNTDVTALLHINGDVETGTIRLYGVGGRLLHTYNSLEQFRSDLLKRPAGIYLIEANGQTSKLLKP
jgi:hypothetical protein